MKKSLLFISAAICLSATAQAEVLGTVLVAEDGRIACHSGPCGNSADGKFVAFRSQRSAVKAQALAVQMGDTFTPVVFQHSNNPLFLSPEDTLDLVQQTQQDEQLGRTPPAPAGNPVWDELMKTRVARFTICAFSWDPPSPDSFVNVQCAQPIGGGVSFAAVFGADNSTPGAAAFIGFTTLSNPATLLPHMRIAGPDFWTGPKRKHEHVKDQH